MFYDAWLHEKTDFRVESSDVRRDDVIKDLFISGTKTWDTQKVNDFFQSCKAKAILATPIPKSWSMIVLHGFILIMVCIV